MSKSLKLPTCSLLFAAISSLASSATVTIADPGRSPKVFQDVQLRGAATEEGTGLVLQLALAADGKAHPVALSRISSIDFGDNDAARYSLLLEWKPGEFKRFEGVRFRRYDGTTLWAYPQGHDRESPIDAKRLVYIEEAQASSSQQESVAPPKADPWKAQIAAQAFLVNKKGGRPWDDGSRKLISRNEERFATAVKDSPVTEAYRGIIGKPLQQTRFLGPSGDVVDLDTLREGRPLFVLVLRGFPGYVCPFCTAQTAAVLRRLAEFDAAGVRVTFIYPGPADTVPVFLDAVRDYRKNNEIPVPILFDPELSIVRKIGLEGDIAKPSTLLIDSSGVVRYAYVGASPDDRPTVDAMLREAAKLNAR